MDVDKLVRMANRIGDFFAAMPDHDEAVEGVALHLKRFWEPRMRRQLLAHADKGGATGLKALVAEALQRHRAMLQP